MGGVVFDEVHVGEAAFSQETEDLEAARIDAQLWRAREADQAAGYRIEDVDEYRTHCEHLPSRLMSRIFSYRGFRFGDMKE